MQGARAEGNRVENHLIKHKLKSDFYWNTVLLKKEYQLVRGCACPS